ncbi:MAG: rod shape-determining protein MreC [Candidatus Aminicenantales bacterium]|jgi:rod shape-determining protein MreC
MPLARPERKKILIVSGLIVVQLFLVSLQVPLGEQPSLMARAVFFVLAPAEHAVRGLTGAAAGVWNRYLYLRGVETQNQAMRDELFHLRQENIHLRQGLSRLLDREAAAALLAGLKRSFRMASVIGVDAVNVHKSVIVDLGRADGLVPNQPVVDGDGRLVGRMIEPISRREGTVELITNDACSVGVVSEKSRVVGILAGAPERGLCRLKYILSTNDNLEPQEGLVTSGFDKIYPPGIPVGRILSIRKTAALFKIVIVRPYAELHRLTTVAVLTAEQGGHGER